METEAESLSGGGGGVGGGEIETAKRLREQLESRIESRHKEHQELLLSLQTLIPELHSSLNLSLNILSTFHRRPFTPLSPPPPTPAGPIKKPHLEHHPQPHLPLPPKKPSSSAAVPRPLPADVDTSMSLLRSMVAVCLLERIPFDPIDSSMLLRKLHNDPKATPADKAALRDAGGDVAAVESALRSMASDNGGCLELVEDDLVSSNNSGGTLMVMSIDRTRLLRELPETQDSDSAVNKHSNSNSNNNNIGGWPALEAPGQHMYSHGMRHIGGGGGGSGGRGFGMMHRQLQNLNHHHNQGPPPPNQLDMKTDEEMMKDVEDILSKKSFKETQKSEAGKEIFELLHRRTAREKAIADKFKTKGGPQLQHYCLALTKEDCRLKRGSYIACEKVHFRRIVAPHTDISNGDCSFLDTCRHMKTCKYVHYELDPTPDVSPMMGTLAPPKPLKTQRAEYCSEVELGESQWISCDIRNFRMDILGQFGVIMADPPWDIHMELPYGTMADEEMRNLNIPALQTDGLIFLWVTGRAMELGRECLELWGYKRVEEIIWVKTNQLQRIIRTGRTGHWLNHSKEHCLVGIKGNPLVNRNIDTDVIVAEVRETSRKPDEMYPLLERISPRTRKLELFARMHNTQSGWLSLGNQLNGARLVDEGLRARFKAAYPDVEVQPSSPPRSSAMEMEMEENGGVTTPFSGVDTSTTPTIPAVTINAPQGKSPPPIQDVEMVG